MADKLYLYLTRRDKTGMKLLSVFTAPKSVSPTRLTNIETMNLPTELSDEIIRSIELNRMLFEPWIETANGFQELLDSLKKRGYKNLPISASPMHALQNPLKKIPRIINISSRKTMLRRGSKPS